jgi:hypothetical protein
MAPALGALVKVAPSNPAKGTTWAMPSVSRMILAALRTTASVRASEAPGGSWAIDLVIDEIEHASPLPVLLVGEADLDDWRAGARLAELAGLGGPLISEIISLAHIEIEPDRIERHDRR